MTSLAALLSEPPPPRAWFLEPRDKLPASELDRQRTFLAMMARLAPGVMVYANVNAARRTLWEARNAKREGMISGVLDLVCAWQGGVAWIEFKSGTGSVSAAQREFLSRLAQMGHHVAVFRRADSAIAWLREHGCPINGGGEIGI